MLIAERKKFGLNLFNKEINSHEETVIIVFNQYHFKTFLVTLLSLTLLFSISCSNEGTTGGGTKTLSYYAGDWWVSVEGTEQRFFTINADGSVIIYGDPDTITIPSADITKNSDTSYTYHDAEMNANMHFNFTSDTKGIVVEGTTAFNVTKK